MQARQTSTIRDREAHRAGRTPRELWLDAWLPMAVWLGVMVVVIAAAQYSLAAERSRIEDAFRVRTEATADQVTAAIDLRQEQLAERASELLASDDVTPDQTRTVLSGLGFDLGGVFDDEGRYITSTAFDEERVGRDHTDDLPHLRTAVQQGRWAVSGVLVPPALGTGVVGIAVPYDTPQGRRIVVGGMTLRSGVLDEVLIEGLRLHDIRSDIIDGDGHVVASIGGDAALPDESTPYAAWDPAAAAAAAAGSAGRYDDADGVEHYFARTWVDGTDWQLVADGAADSVFGGLLQQRRTATVLTGGLGLLGLVLAITAVGDRRRRREAEQAVRDLNDHLETLVDERTAELRETLQRSEDLNRELERALGVRDDILAATGHELRTPLTPMQGLFELLDSRWDELDRTSLRRFLDVIGRNTSRLSELVEQLLLATSIRSGAISATPEPVEIRPAIRDVLDAHPETATVEVQGPEVAVWCQPDHLEQILEVLVDNAASHGCAPYEVTIEVDGSTVAVRVTDHGTVAKAISDDMFELFAQGSTGDTRDVDGLGLGLPNARALADANGGRLTYRTDPSGNPVFTLLLDAVLQGPEGGTNRRRSGDTAGDERAPAPRQLAPE